MTRMAMLIDTSKCTGCRGCQVACKQWWDLPETQTQQTGSYENPTDLSPQTWTRITFHEYESGGRFQWLFLKQGCLHCAEAACVDVCPTSALKHSDLGAVTLESDLCNGCGYCAQFCPFGIPRLETLNLFTGEAKATKCNFCQDRVPEGLKPACVKTCPPGALDWGERDAILEKARSRVEALKARGYAEVSLYGETEMGGLGRLYVLTAPPSAYGLPENPQYPASVPVWQEGVQPIGVGAVALTAVGLGLSWLIGRRMAAQDSSAKKEE